MKLSTAVFALLVSLIPTGVMAQSLRSAYDFLNITSSSRAYGLGGCNISIISPDVTMAGQNPALLGPEIGSQFAAGYMHYMGSANFAGAHYGHSSGERGAWAVSMRYLNYGEITGYDQSGAMTGSFTPSDILAEGTYSHDFTDGLRGGINVKLAYSTYEQYTAVALAADLGINWYDPDHDLSVSAVLKNMGGQLKKFDDSYDHLPFDVQLGLTKGLGESFSFSVTAWNLTKWRLPYYTHPSSTGGSTDEESEMKSDFTRNLFRHLIFAAEYAPTESFFIDLAYNYKTRTDMSAYQRNFFSGFSVGVGIRARSFNVGASFAMPHKAASSILLNVTLDL